MSQTGSFFNPNFFFQEIIFISISAYFSFSLCFSINSSIFSNFFSFYNNFYQRSWSIFFSTTGLMPKFFLHSQFYAIPMCFCNTLRIYSFLSISVSFLNSKTSSCRSFSDSFFIRMCLLATVLSSALNYYFLCIRSLSSCSCSLIFFLSACLIFLIKSRFSASFSRRSTLSKFQCSYISCENFSSRFLSETNF